MNITWANTSKKQLKDAEKVYKSTVKLVLGSCFLKDELNEIKWLNISEPATYAIACLGYQSLRMPGPQM